MLLEIIILLLIYHFHTKFTYHFWFTIISFLSLFGWIQATK